MGRRIHSLGFPPIRFVSVTSIPVERIDRRDLRRIPGVRLVIVPHVARLIKGAVYHVD